MTTETKVLTILFFSALQVSSAAGYINTKKNVVNSEFCKKFECSLMSNNLWDKKGGNRKIIYRVGNAETSVLLYVDREKDIAYGIDLVMENKNKSISEMFQEASILEHKFFLSFTNINMTHTSYDACFDFANRHGESFKRMASFANHLAYCGYSSRNHKLQLEISGN